MSTESRDPRGLLGKLFGKGTVVALLLSVLLIGSGTAREYSVFGTATKTCGSWTEAKEANLGKRVIFHEWINGYMTAYSLWVEDGSGPVNDSEGPGNWAWIDNYCQENPLKTVADAAWWLIDAIKAK